MTDPEEVAEICCESPTRDVGTSDPSLLRLLAAVSPIVFTCGAGPEYAIESISDNVTGHLGYDAHELVDDLQFWADRLHPEDRPHVLATLALFPWRDERILTYRIRHKDGSYRRIQDRRRAVAGSQGSRAVMTGYWAAITEEGSGEVDSNHHETLFRHLIEHSSDIIVVLDEASNVTYASPSVKKIVGFEQQEVIGLSAFHFFHHEDTPAAQHVMAGLLARPGHIGVLRLRCRHKDGTWRHMEGIGKAIRGESGSLELIWNARDITENTKSENELRKLSQAVEQSPVTVMITDLTGRIEYVNPKFEVATGYRRADVLGKNPRFLKSGHTSEDQYRRLWKTILSGEEWFGEFHNRKKNGELFWEYARISPIKGPNGEITHFLAVKEDITVQKNFEDRLIHQARFDSLTELPNRVTAIERLSNAVVRSQQQKTVGALLFVDVDQFKDINDALGHAAGDEVLSEMARRFGVIVRESDTVARFGGDEFLLILENLRCHDDIGAFAGKVRDRISGLYGARGEEAFVSVSIGITLFPTDGTDPEVLMSNADTAMYSAKQAGRNRYQFFSPIMNERLAARIAIEQGLRPALKNDEFVVHYQPIVAVRSGSVVGTEALVRWDHPDKGLIPPERFVPAAEGIGLIVPIGTWVLTKACEQAVQWIRQLGMPLRLAVNFSPRQVKEDNLLNVVSDALKRSGLAAPCLELEITENLLLEADDETATKLKELKSMGVRLALDDFGTGYSSLSSLQRFPFNVVKIDRSFVHRASKNSRASSLVGSIIAMAHALGLEVTAEGVEEGDDLELLRAQNCDFVQGYFFGKPLTAQGFTEFLKSPPSVSTRGR
jgi:diguanylate cyclase (GGDEF)-like protein/PAS domain S-box-containing protein